MKSLVIGLSLSLAVVAQPLFAHCDSVKGPVVIAAQQALEKGDVNPVLKWVPAGSETEVRDAFARTSAVRKQGAEARELADRWFFETLVRVHREAEGAPFTGLKGAGIKPEEGIELADEAIASGSLADAEKALLGEISSGLRKRYAEVLAARKHADENVEEGRHFVHAYVEFIHYAERVRQSAAGSAAHHE